MKVGTSKADEALESTARKIEKKYLLKGKCEYRLLLNQVFPAPVSWVQSNGSE